MTINHFNTDLNSFREVKVLGYSGSYLSLIFECLTALNYRGKVNIIIIETEKRAVAPFETNIPFTEIFYTDLEHPSGKEYLFSSNKPSTKKFLFQFYQDLWKINHSEFANIIHPSAVVSSTVTIDSGLQMEPLSVIAPYTKIGFGVNIGRNCSIGHHNIIGDFCSIYLGANLAGSTKVGEGSTIGPGCTIFSNIEIGSNTIIGGGSVLTKNIPSGVLAFENPCQIIKTIT